MATNGMFNAIITKVTLTFVFLLAACGGGDSGNQAVAPENGSELSSSYDYGNGAFTTSSSFGFVNPQSSSSVQFFYGSSSSFLISSPSSSSSQIYSKSSTSIVKSSSSSKKIQSSSSVKKKSSSSSVPYSSMTDSRDGQTYRIVNIGKQTWMAENLNYKIDGSSCYLEKNEYCDKYGRLYDWESALKACPSGWHLPTTTEWCTLKSYVGDESGKKLKSKKGWYGNNNALDSYGFSALPAGVAIISNYRQYSKEGYVAYFWSLDENGNSPLFWMDSSAYAKSGKMSNDQYTYAFSIRCLKGESTYVPSSSSSKVSTSSSSQQISSSSQIVVTKGSMKDSRDGQIYKTITIGDQTWMAENLNFLNPNERSFYTCPFDTKKCTEDDLLYVSPSYCAYDKPSYCSKYGRLYSWSAAMDSTGDYSTNGLGCGYHVYCKPKYPVRGICPAGWHLPTHEEWKRLDTLVKKVYGKGKADYRSVSGWSANADLNRYRFENISVWDGCETSEINDFGDDFGFSVLPAGCGSVGSTYIGFNSYTLYKSPRVELLFGDMTSKSVSNNAYVRDVPKAYFWTASEGYDEPVIFTCTRRQNIWVAGFSSSYAGSWYSVRCVKD